MEDVQNSRENTRETRSMDFDWNHQTGVSMDDVGGMEELKEELEKEVIRPLTTDREKAKKLGITAPNILFHGPPGTGKTYIAKALATELELPFVKISGSDVQSKWINHSAQQVQKLFNEAKVQAKRAGGALIFIDEIDSVLTKRQNTGTHEEDNKVVNEFLNHLEESKEHDVVFIGATNRLDNLDDAATRSGRIDRKIEIGQPDAQARVGMLEVQLKSRSYKIADDNLETIAENAEGYSAADLEGIVEDAARNAAFERDADVITLEDIRAVDETLVERTDPDLTPDEVIGKPTETNTNSASRTERSSQSKEFSSVYRIVGFGDEARRMALYDIPRDDTVWVNTIGYDDDIRSVLEEVDSGNVIEATVTDAGNKNEYWDLRDIEISENTILYFVQTDGYTPGPTEGIWEERSQGDSVITAGRSPDGCEKYLYEIQLQANYVTTDDGEKHKVYPSLQRGELLTEPFFQGNGCNHLPDGAKAVIIVNPASKPYVAMYLFPNTGPAFNEIWGALYDHVTEFDL